MILVTQFVYAALPLSALLWTLAGWFIALAMPKSANLISPALLNRTFDGETSRWTMPLVSPSSVAACAKSNAAPTRVR